MFYYSPEKQKSKSDSHRLKIFRRLLSNLSLGVVEETPEEHTDPYDTSSIRAFLGQRYRGATLLEEHQVPSTTPSLISVCRLNGLTPYSIRAWAAQ